jgi:hypothetical protein
MTSGSAGWAGVADFVEVTDREGDTTVIADEDDLVVAALEPFELPVGLTRTLSA